MLHYRGAGFVSIYEASADARFVIRSAHLELINKSGRMQDPLGPNSLKGAFIATRSGSQVTSALAQLREQQAMTGVSQPGSHEGPPPRGPIGP
jgi:hypothetical protein